MEKRKIICVSCPVGCELTVSIDQGEIIAIDGNTCKLGIAYAKQEIFDPKRMVASTVKVTNGLHPLVPVYTEGPVSKYLIMDVLAEIREIEIEAPIKMNDIVLTNVLNTGVNIIASRNMPRKQNSEF